ncbi:MAG: deoxycytidylate deaminase [Sphingomonas bacterium]|uniref:anti-phage dCTP deaminase n=1 Tax=Sphingomonas bacterium TaxID=1895847 RepID=UPI002632ED87|nr:anti-phage dCTP deaminase [Sphingomonas bacterium]MDB5709771.1 deoxycytidylate deaminase [Sphingomonas bacterium]
MSGELSAIRYPELVFGIAGPIGIEIDEIAQTLTQALAAVQYQAVLIRVTAEIAQESSDIQKPSASDYASEMGFKMDHASAVCRKFGSADALMRFAMRAIWTYRASIHAGTSGPDDPEPGTQVVPRTAYIIRQLKRPEEVDLLRKVYGRQFVLVSAYGSADSRKRILETKLKRSLQVDVPEHEVSAKADALMHRDMNEDGDVHGQHLRETFHLADVFVDGVNKAEMEAKATRFIQALFGRNDIAPTKAEYGMYAAKSASLRSSDLSRQVGAAIFSLDGELITQGCNEVPKAFGGTYWDGEDPDYRDIKLGHDPNDVLKREVIRDLLERLQRHGMLSKAAKAFGSSSEIVSALLRPSDASSPTGTGALNGALVTDLTEYGRVVHAEMCAICDAARLGRSLKNGILYCTTFPCHNCTKHILAAGIARVVYMEPYPKSKAKELHEHEIEIERESVERVAFMPFLGISPYRYRDIFQKGKRKKEGAAVPWYEGEPRPMLDVGASTYTDLEAFEIAKLVGEVRRSKQVAKTTTESKPFSRRWPFSQRSNKD